tara:strand:- start:495 stop:692 length:198 start_codon:yes stop_codon:yes gene_type:complete
MKPINLTFEEIRDMHEKGTLDQYILSNGYRYQDVLRFAMEKTSEKVDDLENEVEGLEDTLSELRY